ncbi:unnamed protein product [Orchesella dallaii]|uniref:Uncharacterized protein n=1 Tax=Orchesella dallaii TaxID=48710 RepID=A0ABP1RIZ8_9HEXA
MEQKSFAIFEFFADNSIEVVPTCWLLRKENAPSEKICFSHYPEKLNSKQIRKLVKKCADVNIEWPKYDGRVIGWFDEFEAARSKLKIATYTSDFSGADTMKIKSEKPELPTLPSLTIQTPTLVLVGSSNNEKGSTVLQSKRLLRGKNPTDASCVDNLDESTRLTILTEVDRTGASRTETDIPSFTEAQDRGYPENVREPVHLPNRPVPLSSGCITPGPWNTAGGAPSTSNVHGNSYFTEGIHHNSPSNIFGNGIPPSVSQGYWNIPPRSSPNSLTAAVGPSGVPWNGFENLTSTNSGTIWSTGFIEGIHNSNGNTSYLENTSQKRYNQSNNSSTYNMESSSILCPNEFRGT